MRTISTLLRKIMNQRNKSIKTGDGLDVLKELSLGIESKASLRLRLFCMIKYMHQYKQKR